jgi:3D (Asp-Asp-Asp) domain-containing protein
MKHVNEKHFSAHTETYELVLEVMRLAKAGVTFTVLDDRGGTNCHVIVVDPNASPLPKRFRLPGYQSRPAAGYAYI